MMKEFITEGILYWKDSLLKGFITKGINSWRDSFLKGFFFNQRDFWRDSFWRYVIKKYPFAQPKKYTRCTFTQCEKIAIKSDFEELNQNSKKWNSEQQKFTFFYWTFNATTYRIIFNLTFNRFLLLSICFLYKCIFRQLFKFLKVIYTWNSPNFDFFLPVVTSLNRRVSNGAKRQRIDEV